MPIFLLNEDEELFPPPELTDPSGILAVGGAVTPKRLLAAYRRGIFPWYSEGQPILWHCPDPRFVLLPADLHVPRSLKKKLRHPPYEIRFDTAFPDVMRQCGKVPRPGQRGTWITQEMLDGYVELHRLGYAHSAEAWREGTLVGGLYGVWLGSLFFGESMFAEAEDASKLAFAVLMEKLVAAGCTLVDCQAETEHLARFGAVNWARGKFLAALQRALEAPTQVGRWDPERGPPART